ncbi:hypothetical protein [Marinibacterium profundimaris]|uniref:hypothetical protein n=1 Tax=Marinibacterium profundimaris TaxID=1679460 RepID=UPI00117F3804|nr:hypothetical protein [Marinibacterium profundimaris]
MHLDHPFTSGLPGPHGGAPAGIRRGGLFSELATSKMSGKPAHSGFGEFHEIDIAFDAKLRNSSSHGVPDEFYLIASRIDRIPHPHRSRILIGRVRR